MSLELAPPAREVHLSYRFEPGQRLRYRVETSLEQEVLDEGRPVRRDQRSLVLDMTREVLAVEPDGSAHVLTSLQQPDGSQQTLYQHLNPQGWTLRSAGLDPGSYALLPETPLRTGATWQGEIELDLPLVERVKFAYDSTLASLNAGVAEIEVRAPDLSLELPLPDGSATARMLIAGEGRYRFDTQVGRILRLEMTLRTWPRVGTASFDTTQRLLQELIS